MYPAAPRVKVPHCPTPEECTRLPPGLCPPPPRSIISPAKPRYSTPPATTRKTTYHSIKLCTPTPPLPPLPFACSQPYPFPVSATPKSFLLPHSAFYWPSPHRHLPIFPPPHPDVMSPAAPRGNVPRCTPR